MVEKTNTKSKWQKAPEELVKFFQDTMGAIEGVDNRKMFGYPCSFINGNMFTGLHQDNWVVRLPENDREILKREFNASQFEPMAGRPMREYVILPKEIIKDPKKLIHWINLSRTYASSLPVKKKAPKRSRK